MSIGNRLVEWGKLGDKRHLSGRYRTIFAIVACGLSVYQIWSVVWWKLAPINQMAIHVALVLMLCFMLYGSKRNLNNVPTIMDHIYILLACGAGIYFAIHAERISGRVPVIEPLSPLDIFFGFVFVLLSMEAARRTIGLPVVLIVFIGICYGLFGHFLKGIWAHREIGLVEFIDELAYSFNGLWGSPIAVAASFVFMFLLFGAFLQKAGAGEFFFKLSTSLAGRSKGGAAKVAILTSALFGSISGSPTANVVTTGSFTIPVSKKTGYKASFAAAIEAAASTGGSILPPIMGSSAFLMAAVTKLSYGAIVLAAVIPGILYYVSLLTMVHLEASRLNLARTKQEEIPRLFVVLKQGWHYFIPLIMLVLFLIQGYSASRTGFYGILSIVVISWFRKQTRMGIKEIVEAMIQGAKSAIPVTTACAAAGLVIASIMSTGLGGKLTSIVLGLTEGMLIPTLILVMVICIILGMGMPVAAAYILTAMLAAPALIELGVSVMAAHLFIVYFSIFSAITPPVAVAAFAAAGIADENPNRVGFGAIRLGIVGFIIPFMFVLEPALLLDGPMEQVLLSVVTSVIGVILLSAGVIGWLYRKALIVERLVLIVAGVMSIYPGIVTDAIGILCLLVIIYFQYRRRLEKESTINSRSMKGSRYLFNPMVNKER